MSLFCRQSAVKGLSVLAHRESGKLKETPMEIFKSENESLGLFVFV